MNWNGNLTFRALIKSNKVTYFESDLKAKKQISKTIVHQIYSLSPPGRFLKIHHDEWLELSYKEAISKARQALREDAKCFINRRSEEERNHNRAQESSNTRFVSNQEINIIDHTPFNLIIESSDNSASPNGPTQQIIERK